MWPSTTLHRTRLYPPDAMTTTMRRLRSSLKLGSKDKDDYLCSTNKTSLKRSNAKLQRKNDYHGFDFFDIPEEEGEEVSSPAVLAPVKPFQHGHSLRPYVSDSLTNSARGPASIPFEDLIVEALQPDAAPTFTRTDSQHDAPPCDKRRESKSLSKIFGRGRPRQEAPVDNFTKWDVDRQAAYEPLHRQPPDVALDSMLASAILDISAAAAGPSMTQPKRQSLESNPYHEATRARRSWARRLDPIIDVDDDVEQDQAPEPMQKEKRQAICDLNWDDYADSDALLELLRSYGGTTIGEPRDLSPADSGVDLGEDERPSKGKGKSRAVEQRGEKHNAGHRALDVILTRQRRLKEDRKRQQQEWDEEEEALRLEQEKELARVQQIEEERQAAEALARELERQQEEEEDRARAEELFRAEESARLAAALLKLKECACCGDEKKTLEFPPHPPTYTCEHPSQTCTECMRSWLASEFSTKGATDLKCPECPQTLAYEDIQRAATEETFQSYEKLLIRTALGSLEHFSWCLNPDGCENGQENDTNENYMQCVVCKYQQCIKHQCAWHTNETCEQYDYRTSGDKARDEEAKTQAMLDEVSKRCPGKGCGWRIQKIDGCDHMTCKQCRWEFCWECLASHREIKRVGNEAHEDWCKFHSKNLETSWPFNMHA